jgi:hypothetical protein
MVKEAKNKKDDEKVRKVERENARLDQRKWCQGSKEEEDEEEEDDNDEENDEMEADNDVQWDTPQNDAVDPSLPQLMGGDLDSS